MRVAIGAKSPDIEVFKAVRRFSNSSLPQLKACLATGMPFVYFPESMDGDDYDHLEDVLETLEGLGVVPIAYEIEGDDDPSMKNRIPVEEARKMIKMWRDIGAARRAMDAEDEADLDEDKD